MELHRTVSSPNNANQKSERKRKEPHCSFCKNHGKMSTMQKHECKFKGKCTCILCQLTKKSQIIMCHQQRVWRHNNQKEKDKDKIKGQKCDNCRNHLQFIKKSNHECPHKHCECAYCKLTFKRREIMKHIQRARRLEITCDSDIQETEKATLRELNILNDDKEVDELMEQTRAAKIQRPLSSMSVSPAQTDSSMESKPYTNLTSPSTESKSYSSLASPSIFKGTELQGIPAAKDKKYAFPCIYDLATSNMGYYQGSTVSKRRIRRATDSPQSSAKYNFEENSLDREHPFSLISPFHSQEQLFYQTPDEEVKPPLFNRNLILPPREKPRLPSPQRLISELSSFPTLPVNPYPWSSYIPPNPFFYPPPIENRQPERQPILRPEPIKPVNASRSSSNRPLFFPPFFLRSPTADMHGLLAGHQWENPFNPNTYTATATDILRAMQPRHQMIPPYLHVKVRSE